MLDLTCTPNTTQQQLYNFSVGCYFSDYLPIVNNIDLLTPAVRYNIEYQEWIQHFRINHMKKNNIHVKDTDKCSTLFVLLRDNAAPKGYSFSQKFRVVTYRPPAKETLKGCMQLLGVYSGEKCGLMLRIFEAVKFLERRSELQGVTF